MEEVQPQAEESTPQLIDFEDGVVVDMEPPISKGGLNALDCIHTARFCAVSLGRVSDLPVVGGDQ